MNKYFPVMALAFALAIAYLPSCQKNSQIFGADDQDLSSAVVGDRGDSTHCDSLHPHHPHHPFDSTGGHHPHDTLGHGPHHPIDTTGGGIHPHHPIDTTGTGGGHHPTDTTGNGGGHPGGPHGGGHGGGHGPHGG